MADNRNTDVEKRIVTDTLIYQPIVEALKAAGFKARLDENRSFTSGDGSVAIYFEPMSRDNRNRLVDTLVGSGLYLDKDQGLAKSFPSAVKSHFDDDLYHDKDVNALVRAYSDPIRDDNYKPTGDYKTRVELGGIELSFRPGLDPNGRGLTYESAQKLANAIRKQAGKEELPIQKAPEKLPTLAELEKTIPDFKEPTRPADPAKLVKALAANSVRTAITSSVTIKATSYPPSRWTQKTRACSWECWPRCRKKPGFSSRRATSIPTHPGTDSSFV